MSDELHDESCGCQEYNELSRRSFLGAAATFTAASMFPAWLPKIVMAKNHASNRDIIVSIFQRGGADGLSIVYPFLDDAYYTSRPTIGFARPGNGFAFALDNQFAIAPAMVGGDGTGGLMPAFAAKDLLIAHGVGIQTNNTRSHFDAQRFMEVGKPADPTIITGWLGRHLASIPPLKPDALLRGIGVANGLQKTLVAPTGGTLFPTHTLPIADPTNFTIGGTSTTAAARTTILEGDYQVADEPLKSAALDAINTVSLLKSVNFTGYKPANNVTYPTSAFGRALRSVAVLIKNDVGIEAAQIDIGGWDTHASQGAVGGGMKTLMQDFSNSLAAFYADVIAPGGFNVTVIAMSEFGRNVRENASQGTDHGRGTVMFAMGNNIAGGRVLTQNWKSLDHANLEAGQDLVVGTDYRDILSEIVQNRLGNPNLDFIFPTWQANMLGVTR
ncbi:MAG TPA: DUF1501 domain-containing protein [Gemmatimonadaceae bacterium]|nr:DUF1501 domain-containing protein [Gemmatimonadaceae bacterium]